MLSGKSIYAFYQTYFCFLSNVRLFANKYINYLTIQGKRIKLFTF